MLKLVRGDFSPNFTVIARGDYCNLNPIQLYENSGADLELGREGGGVFDNVIFQYESIETSGYLL